MNSVRLRTKAYTVRVHHSNIGRSKSELRLSQRIKDNRLYQVGYCRHIAKPPTISSQRGSLNRYGHHYVVCWRTEGWNANMTYQDVSRRTKRLIARPSENKGIHQNRYLRVIFMHERTCTQTSTRKMYFVNRGLAGPGGGASGMPARPARVHASRNYRLGHDLTTPRRQRAT